MHRQVPTWNREVVALQDGGSTPGFIDEVPRALPTRRASVEKASWPG